jgi:8-oxo-dGTP pyrophosphatase MutT (NUDIX family)
LLRGWSVVRRPHLRGVKCIVRDTEGRVLWVRHTYGDRTAWELPGGATRRSESALEAARREAREELGVDMETWLDIGTVTGRWTGAHLALTCCLAEWPAGAQLDTDPVEIDRTQWAPAGAPPGRVGRVTAGALPLITRTVG